MTDPIRLLVVDDHSVVRSGIRALLSTEEDIEVVAEASSGDQALAIAAEHRPDVVLMDLVMPGVSGVEAIERMRAVTPFARFLILTSFAADDLVMPALRAGAHGYLLKDTSPADLVQAIRQVGSGQSWLHPEVAKRVVNELTGNFDSVQAEQLTERELDVLRLLAEGDSNQSIAIRLSITEATVRTHVTSLLRKLGLTSRTQAALYALRTGVAKLA